MNNENKKINAKQAADYVILTESGLEELTGLGLVDYWELENGEATYLESDLDNFATFYLTPILKAINWAKFNNSSEEKGKAK